MCLRVKKKTDGGLTISFLFISLLLLRAFYYLSKWYPHAELASRAGIFYAALVASSAFGGLLAYGMFQIRDDGYFQWSYLFFLEGGLTVLWALLLGISLPSEPHQAWFLSPLERRAASMRVNMEAGNSPAGQDNFEWRQALRDLMTAHVLLRFIMNFLGGTILTSNANFLAMIVKRLGYGTVKTNLV